jgi:23S rRNA (guanine2445-N2)-methyltransferase / 23S rRNA (guanine2069-N7)-methyltransferase
MTPIRYFATAAKGTEDLLAAEIEALGARGVEKGRGGVHFRGDLAVALDANLWLRTAMRVLEPVAEFAAPDADALYEGVKAVRWEDRITPRHTLAVDASVRDSGVTHSHYAELRVKDAIVDALRDRVGSRPSVDKRDPDLRIVLHLARNRATLSLDLSGEPLFQRGYRKSPARASLKETLAAAVVLGSGWNGETPFHDPLCGSGTIAIEAAMIAAHMAPGINRAFGVERWPTFGEAERRLLTERKEAAKALARALRVPILASDRSEEAITAAKVNAHAAHLMLQIRVADARQIEALSPPGTVAFNPPYGERISPGNKTLKTLYWQLSQRMKNLSGHTVAVLAGHPGFEGAFGIRPTSRRALFNGPIPCELLVYRLP